MTSLKRRLNVFMSALNVLIRHPNEHVYGHEERWGYRTKRLVLGACGERRSLGWIDDLLIREIRALLYRPVKG